VWQFDGQWCMITDHDSRAAGTVPSLASVAEPRKLIASPTPQVKLLAGASMVAVGGASPAVMTTASVPNAPWLSPAINLAVYVPGCV
jgi:hypothetical protein